MRAQFTPTQAKAIDGYRTGCLSADEFREAMEMTGLDFFEIELLASDLSADDLSDRLPSENVNHG
jgi:hypothetical protein